MNQITIFDLIEKNEPFTCDTCRYNEKGCCSYNEPLGRYCVNGNAYEKAAPVFPGCDFSEVVEYIEERTGVHFVEDDYMGKRNNSYICKASKHLTLMLGLGRFYPEVNNGALFISAGFVFQSKQIPYTGSSGPFEDVDKVVEFFNKTKEKYLEPQ